MGGVSAPNHQAAGGVQVSYLLAVLLPPLGCLMEGKVGIAILLLLLMCTVVGWPIASIIAVLIVLDVRKDNNNRRAT